MTSQAAYKDGAQMLLFLRALGTEEQRIAYAVLQGMQIQKRIDEQRVNQETAPKGARQRNNTPAPA